MNVRNAKFHRTHQEMMMKKNQAKKTDEKEVKTPMQFIYGYSKDFTSVEE